MNDTLLWIMFIAAAYLIGSIPFGYLIGKSKGVDIREHGSKNIGATNTGRVLGKKWGIICFVLDVGKGLVPTAGAGIATGLLDLTRLQVAVEGAPAAGLQFLWLGVGIAAILGHMFPLYLRLRGGKGVATALGVMLGVYPYLTFPVFGALIVWVACIRIFRMVSLASMIASLSLPGWLLVGCIPYDIDTNPDASFGARVAAMWPFLVVSLMLAILIIARHRTNISRIFAGTEPKIGRKGGA